MHWFVVVNQREARVYVKSTDRKKIRLLKTIINPLGLENKRDLIRKQAGRGVKSIGRTGSISYSVRKRSDPRDAATTQFARSLCHALESDKLKKKFDSLTVFAEPRLLGKIRSEMDLSVQKLVKEWVKQDLQKTPIKELTHFLVPDNSEARSDLNSIYS